MAAWICSGVASDVASFGEGGGDGYLEGWVGFFAEENVPGEEMGTEKCGAGVGVDWKRRVTGDQHTLIGSPAVNSKEPKNTSCNLEVCSASSRTLSASRLLSSA